MESGPANGRVEEMPMTEDRTEWMTPGEVAAILRVDPKTVGRWAKQGKITYFRTPGGHRRFLRKQIMEMIKDATQEPIGNSTSRSRAVPR